jgi:hypothetical protein
MKGSTSEAHQSVLVSVFYVAHYSVGILEYEEEVEEEVEQPPNYGRRHRGNHERDQPYEEWFGKLKFTIPKFDGGSDPETYLTWELKVD